MMILLASGMEIVYGGTGYLPSSLYTLMHSFLIRWSTIAGHGVWLIESLASCSNRTLYKFKPSSKRRKWNKKVMGYSESPSYRYTAKVYHCLQVTYSNYPWIFNSIAVPL